MDDDLRNVSLYAAKYIAFKHKLEAQNSWNCVGVEQPRRKTSDAREGGMPWAVRGLHHGPWCLPPPRAPIFLSVTFWCFFLDRGIWHGLVVLGSFGPLLLSSLIDLASKTISNHLFRASESKSAKTLKTSKTTRNRRNRGINRITIYFNPLKWLLNT